MHLTQVDDYDALSDRAAAHVAALIKSNPRAAVVAATGNTPLGCYAKLTEKVEREGIPTEGLRLFQLDEYLGISEDDPRSLFGWMEKVLLGPLAIGREQVTRLRGDDGDWQTACGRYVQAVSSCGGFDLAVLGLGPNGHLGFNEPPSEPDAPTRVVELSEASVESNARYWGGRGRVPRRAITVGMDLLLKAKTILLLVSGEHKADILKKTIEGPVTADVPSSLLRNAGQVTIVADTAACSRLSRVRHSQ